MDARQTSEKRYGLIKPAKKACPSAFKSSVFNNESSSDDKSPPPENWGKAALERISHGSVQAAQTRKVIRQAMQEDASLFQYDEIYDDMQQQKRNKAETKNLEDNKKPRYMRQLLRSAEERRQQQERRVERQVQLERQQEGDHFADKEQFVTEAYRRRLQERRQQEERERKIKHIEELNDVTKQKDLGSFYRHMYHKSVSRAEPEPEPAPPPAVKSEPGSEPEPAAGTEADRQYRPIRVSSSPESELTGSVRTERRHRHSAPAGRPSRDTGEQRSSAGRHSDSESDSGSYRRDEPLRPRASSADREHRRRAIYAKRTVDAMFDAARHRYLERRAARRPVPS